MHYFRGRNLTFRIPGRHGRDRMFRNTLTTECSSPLFAVSPLSAAGLVQATRLGDNLLTRDGSHQPLYATHPNHRNSIWEPSRLVVWPCGLWCLGRVAVGVWPYGLWTLAVWRGLICARRLGSDYQAPEDQSTPPIPQVPQCPRLSRAWIIGGFTINPEVTSHGGRADAKAIGRQLKV